MGARSCTSGLRAENRRDDFVWTTDEHGCTRMGSEGRASLRRRHPGESVWICGQTTSRSSPTARSRRAASTHMGARSSTNASGAENRRGDFVRTTDGHGCTRMGSEGRASLRRRHPGESVWICGQTSSRSSPTTRSRRAAPARMGARSSTNASGAESRRGDIVRTTDGHGCTRMGSEGKASLRRRHPCESVWIRGQTSSRSNPTAGSRRAASTRSGVRSSTNAAGAENRRDDFVWTTDAHGCTRMGSEGRASLRRRQPGGSVWIGGQTPFLFPLPLTTRSRSWPLLTRDPFLVTPHP